MPEVGATIDKMSKLLEVLDKHLKEKNCEHSTTELFEEYEIDDFSK